MLWKKQNKTKSLLVPLQHKCQPLQVTLRSVYGWSKKIKKSPKTSKHTAAYLLCKVDKRKRFSLILWLVIVIIWGSSAITARQTILSIFSSHLWLHIGCLSYLHHPTPQLGKKNVLESTPQWIVCLIAQKGWLMRAAWANTTRNLNRNTASAQLTCELKPRKFSHVITPHSRTRNKPNGDYGWAEE